MADTNKLSAREIIQSYSGPKLRIMEVCGTHTHEIFRLGIRNILLLSQLCVDFYNKNSIRMSHPDLKRFNRNSCKVSLSTEVHTEIMAAYCNILPGRQVLPFRE